MADNRTDRARTDRARMNGGFLAVYGAAAATAAIADSATGSTTRPWLVAVLEAAPVAVLGWQVVTNGERGTRRPGGRAFGVAMLLAAIGLIASGGQHRYEFFLVLGMIVAVCLALTAAYITAMLHKPRRPSKKAIVAALSPMILIATISALDAAALTAKSPSECGVDSCAWDGLGIALDFIVACECLMLCAVVAALVASAKAGLGMLLADVGFHFVVAVAPSWSQYQGVIGVVMLCGGFLLAARPWLAPAPPPFPAPVPDPRT